MFRFRKKYPYKNIYFAKHQKRIKVGSGSGRIRSFLGHPDPDPYLKNWIRVSGSGAKNAPDPQHCSFLGILSRML